MPSRIYTEIRIEHESVEEKAEFERKLKEQSKIVGNRANYIRLIVNLDAATKIINKLKSE